MKIVRIYEANGMFEAALSNFNDLVHVSSEDFIRQFTSKSEVEEWARSIGALIEE